MGWFSSKDKNKNTKKEDKKSINWQLLNTLEQLDAILKDKTGKKHVLFKHSTRCSISSMAKRTFESEWPIDNQNVDIWYLDLLNYRPISDAIAAKTGVFHQSPQAIAIVDGEIRYDGSHGQISARAILKSLGE